ncbi:MAG: inosine/xanthosine triphosphatase [Candidatus Paceibacterota bacterium]|jgi:non-canonical (house-cleaning) NTP pyrophosphatase
MKISVGSKSDRKINIAKKVFSEFLSDDIKVTGFGAKSGVPETPYGEDTFKGSLNRAKDTETNNLNFDFYVGLESGLIERYGHLYEEAWATVIKEGKEYHGYSSGLKVPDFILDRMNESKMEHCEVMTLIEKEFGSLPNDTWGTYSGGLIERTTSLEEAIRNALIQIFSTDKGFYKK